MAQCFAKSIDRKIEAFPLNPLLIAEYQTKDKQCNKYSGNKKFIRKVVKGVELLMTEMGRLVVPKKLQQRVLAWYHLYH